MRHVSLIAKRLTAITVLSLALQVAPAQAAIITTYSFTGQSAGALGPFAADSSDPGVTASTLAGTSLGTRGVVTAFGAATESSSPAYTFDGRGYEVGVDAMTNTSAGPLPNTHRFTFSVTPTSGNAIQYTNLSLDFGYDFTGSAGGTILFYDLFYSLDGTTFFQQSTTSQSSGTPVSNSHAIINDVTKSFASNPDFANPLTGTVTFQIRVADSNASLNTKYLFLDDIKLSGTVTAVPEPSSVLLVAGSLGLLGWRLMRRRQ